MFENDQKELAPNEEVEVIETEDESLEKELKEDEAKEESKELSDIEKKLRNQKIWKVVRNVLVYLFLTFFAIFSIFPFYWMITSSLKSDAEYRNGVTFFPEDIQWINYKYALDPTNGSFSNTIVNTLLVGFTSTILGVIVTIITAFAFAKLEFKGKNLLFTLLLATMMIPGELYTTTNFVTISKFGWTETYVVMILPFLVSVFYIYLLRNNFKQIPDSLYKAAKVDGCGNMKFVLKVLVPLSAPTLISITLLKFIGTWNSYIWPRLVNGMNGNDDWLLLSNWVSGSFQIPGMTGADAASAPIKMAAACMVSLPLLILFICFRRYIMRGVSKSGTKG